MLASAIDRGVISTSVSNELEETVVIMNIGLLGMGRMVSPIGTRLVPDPGDARLSSASLQPEHLRKRVADWRSPLSTSSMRKSPGKI